MATVDVHAFARHLQDTAGFKPGNPVHAFTPTTVLCALSRSMESETPVYTPLGDAVIDGIRIPRTRRGRDNSVRVCQGVVSQPAGEHQTVNIAFLKVGNVTVGFAQIPPKAPPPHTSLQIVDCR